MANINEVLIDGHMFLEPRLQQYIQKKKYYKKYGIETEQPLEREYSISNNDIRLIRDYLNGKKEFYKYEKKDKYLDLVDTSGQGFSGLDFKNDERYKRFQKKMERNKDATKQRHNYSAWDDGFTKLIPQEQSSQSNRNLDDRFFSMDNSTYTDNPYSSVHTDKKNKRNINYKHNIDNVFNGSDHKKKSQITNDIIGNKKTYAKINDNKYNYENHLDVDAKRNNLSINHKGKKYHNTSSYTSVPYTESDILRDINLESNLRTGKDTIKSDYMEQKTNSRAKSNGYPNPAEHYYDYIYKNNITHSIFPHPENSRKDNKKAKNIAYERDIM